MPKFNVGDSIIYTGKTKEYHGKTGIVEKIFKFNGRYFCRVTGQLRQDFPRISAYSEDCLSLLFDFIND